jgi:hypothetical protein
VTFFALLKGLRRSSIRTGRRVVITDNARRSLKTGVTETKPYAVYAQSLKTLCLEAYTLRPDVMLPWGGVEPHSKEVG